MRKLKRSNSCGAFNVNAMKRLHTKNSISAKNSLILSYDQEQKKQFSLQ